MVSLIKNTISRSDAIASFSQAMNEAGISCQAEIICDGNIHRYNPPNRRDKSGWYIMFDYRTGAFGDHSKGLKKVWHVEPLSDAKRYALEKSSLQHKTSHDVAELVKQFSAHGTSQYLMRKQAKNHEIFFERDTIIIPICDVYGKIWSLQYIKSDGSKRFYAKGKKQGCFFVIGNIADEFLIIVEGYATGSSIHQATKHTVIVAFDAGNIEPVIAAIKQEYPSKNILIAGDNDCWKEHNTGKEKSKEAALKHGAAYILPKFSNTASQPTDFNDLHMLEGLDAVRKQIDTATKKTKLPPNYVLTKEGLFFAVDDSQPLKICSPIEVTAFSHNENDSNHGLILEWISPRNFSKHVWAMPMRLLSGDGREIRERLLDEGLLISPSAKSKQKLLDFLATVEPTRKVLSVSRIGWHGDNFILPDISFPEVNDIVLQSETASFTSFKTSGILADWQEYIGKYAEGNSRLIFIMSCAFAAPLLRIVKEESGGIHFVGSSSTGKTTLLRVAASIWGGGGENGFMRQFRATANAFEAIAENHRDCLLVLDELGSSDSNTVGDTIYMLTNNQGKGRLKSSSKLKDNFEWQVLFVSTGEITLETKMMEANKTPMPGMETRFANIPADANTGFGVFDNLHEFENGDVFSRYLREQTQKHYGTAIREFLKAIVAEHKAHDFIRENVANIRQDFYHKFLPEGADGQVMRVAGRFAVIAAAGEMAISKRILLIPPNSAFDATGRCFQDWLTERGGSKPLEIAKGIKQIMAFFESHASSRFAIMGQTDYVRINNQAGFKQANNEGVFEYYVFPEVLRTEIFRGINPKIILPELIKKGVLIPSKQGRALKNKHLTGIGTKKMYHFSAAILSDEKDDLTLGNEEK